MAKLRIYNDITKTIPQLSYHFRTCVIYKPPQLPQNPTVYTEHLELWTCFHMEFSFFNNIFCRKFSSTLTITDATTSNYFG